MPAKQKLEQYIPFVERVARKVHRRIQPPLQVADLVSYGMVGLSEALKKYDTRSGVPFESFAHYRVRGAILEGISKHCPVSRHIHRRLGLAQKGNDYMSAMSADVSGMQQRSPATDSAMLTGAVRDLASIYTVARLASRREAGESVVEFEDPRAAEQPEKIAVKHELLEFVDRLPDNQRDFIRLYYFEEMTLEQVGAEMGFKKSWGCKLHRAALTSLREMMKTEPGK